MTNSKCLSCNEHTTSSIDWNREIGLGNFPYRDYTGWCDCCLLRVQIEYVKRAIQHDKQLKDKLDKCQCQ